MAKVEHLTILENGVAAWNQWREDNPKLHPDLSEAELVNAHLTRANFSGANFRGAELFRANLIRTDLSGADLSEAYLLQANLQGANLSGANLVMAMVWPAMNLFKKEKIISVKSALTMSWIRFQLLTSILKCW